MAFGPFDSDEDQQSPEPATLKAETFGDSDVEALLADAGRTWDALSSDLQTQRKARR